MLPRWRASLLWETGGRGRRSTVHEVTSNDPGLAVRVAVVASPEAELYGPSVRVTVEVIP